LSTLASSPAPLPSWKLEVNRRLAEHKNRKGLSVVDENAHAGTQGSANSRAAAAAARVAARYAKAPSYSEMLSAEDLAALRAAESRTPHAAQVAAQATFDKIEAGNRVETREPSLSSGSVQEHDLWQTQNSMEPLTAENQEFEIRWDEDMPTLAVGLEESSRSRILSNTWNESAAIADHAGHVYEAVEAAQPIHANLIEFPRELIATRRMRPRLADAYSGSAVDEHGQLSIFEVDPNSISIDPAVSDSSSVSSAPSWSGSEWSAIHLDAHPVYEPEYRYVPETKNASLKQAPIGRRLMATLVDIALIAVMVCGIAALSASQFHHLPGQKATEICMVIAAIVIGVVYQMFFLTVAKTTPGMRWAQISLCTFDDEIPSREQMRERLKAMAVSLIPVGLGLLWAIFDEDNMTWHDRRSRTYLRQC
jgi:uncharacterized RDD family membrane protein YckC